MEKKPNAPKVFMSMGTFIIRNSAAVHMTAGI